MNWKETVFLVKKNKSLKIFTTCLPFLLVPSPDFLLILLSNLKSRNYLLVCVPVCVGVGVGGMREKEERWKFPVWIQVSYFHMSICLSN